MRVRLTRTIGGCPHGRNEPGFIVLAGTGGDLWRVRDDVGVMADEHAAGRDGWLLDERDTGDAGLGYAEVEFDAYLEYEAALDDDEADVAREGELRPVVAADAACFVPRPGPWTVLNVPLEFLARDDR